MSYNCIIVEDEPLAAERLVDYVSRIEALKLQAVFNNPLKALDSINENNVDLLFLDINLKEINGMEFLESINFKGKVIITTAYDQYALKGYELDVIDYLLKPFSFERFLKAVSKFQKQIRDFSKKDYVFIKTENRLEKIKLVDIMYIQGMGDYRQIVCADKKIMTLQTFKELEKLLPASQIIRVHKSYMVAAAAIQSVKNDRIHLKGKVIPTSKTYQENLRLLLET